MPDVELIYSQLYVKRWKVQSIYLGSRVTQIIIKRKSLTLFNPPLILKDKIFLNPLIKTLLTCFETWLAYFSCFGLFGVGLTCTAPYSWLRAGHTLLISPVSLPGFIFFTFFFSTFLLTFVVFLLFYCSYAKEFIYTERLFFHSLSQFQILLAIVTSCGPQPAIFQTRFLVLHGTIIGTNNILFNALWWFCALFFS